MEMIEGIAGVKITPYSAYGAIFMFLMGLVSLPILSLALKNKQKASAEAHTGPGVVVRGGMTEEQADKIFWKIAMVFSLVLFPLLTFIFGGDLLRSAFPGLSMPMVDQFFDGKA